MLKSTLALLQTQAYKWCKTFSRGSDEKKMVFENHLGGFIGFEPYLKVIIENFSRAGENSSICDTSNWVL